MVEQGFNPQFPHLPAGYNPGAQAQRQSSLFDRQVAQHLRVATSGIQVRRGAQVAATVGVTGSPEQVEIGLVCTVAYDRRENRSSGAGSTGGTHTVRATHWETAHEEWRPAVNGETYTFLIPPQAPFSHEGSCLSVSWRVTVREPRRLRFDPAYSQPIWVLP